MNAGEVISQGDISNLVELLDKNSGFKRPDGQTIGYSLQEAECAKPVSSCTATTVQANPVSVALPATVVDQQLRLPLPSESREAKRLQAKKCQTAKVKGYAIWTDEELAASLHPRQGTALKPKDDAEEPEYTIMHKEVVTAEDVYLGMDINKPGSSGLLVKVVMPKLEQLADLAIEVDPYELRVLSTKYYLRAALPQKVVAGKAEAKWESMSKTLNVCLAVDDSDRLL
ncbi:hypothetical protein DQ04_02751010 [Trypanosoma grayi]|uniref:hypothetical protein n=1 Tax=Trypanosoma grayi TaxID=71804 RepID=UPI0004F4B698|nr:hypothetical protein DQ04_02751010 [Trypanosoma grayi]KEG11303.1 hypothetical protein DQ04_02751010 [Trypanosoma grayi]